MNLRHPVKATRQVCTRRGSGFKSEVEAALACRKLYDRASSPALPVAQRSHVQISSANADGDLVSIELSAAALSLDVTHLGRSITDTANEARRRAHALAERHMDDLFRAQEDIVARIHATQELWPTVDDNQAVADGGGSSWPDVDLAEEAINSEVGPDGIMPRWRRTAGH